MKVKKSTNFYRPHYTDRFWMSSYYEDDCEVEGDEKINCRYSEQFQIQSICDSKSHNEIYQSLVTLLRIEANTTKDLLILIEKRCRIKLNPFIKVGIWTPIVYENDNQMEFRDQVIIAKIMINKWSIAETCNKFQVPPQFVQKLVSI